MAAHPYTLILSDSDDDYVEVIPPPIPVVDIVTPPASPSVSIVPESPAHEELPLIAEPVEDPADHGDEDDDAQEQTDESDIFGLGDLPQFPFDWGETVPHDIGYGSTSSHQDENDPAPAIDIVTLGDPILPDIPLDDSVIPLVPLVSQEIPPLVSSPSPVSPFTHDPLSIPTPVGLSSPHLTAYPTVDPDAATVGTVRRAGASVLPAIPTIPSHRLYRLHPDGVTFGYTPRKRVRPHTDAPDSAIPEGSTRPDGTPPPQRLRTTDRDWIWVPSLLRDWREEEGAPSRFEAGESSTAPRTVPVTGEPVEDTMPLVIARVYRHDRFVHHMIEAVDEVRTGTTTRIEDLERRIVELEGRVGELETGREEILATQASLLGYANTQYDLIDGLASRMSVVEGRSYTAEARAHTAEARAAAAEQQLLELRQQLETLAAFAPLFVMMAATAIQMAYPGVGQM